MSSSVQSSPHSSTRWIERHALISYFALAYLIGWIPMIPRVLASRGLLPAGFSSNVSDLILVLSPAISALIITGLTKGRAGVRALLSRYGIWRVGLGWYGVALLLPGLMLLGAIIVGTLLGKFGQAVPPLPAIVTTFIGALVFNGIFNQEEIGWRGFALPRMQARWSALQSSLVLGVIWGLWHIPLFLELGTPNAQLPYLGFVINVIASSILLTWMFNNTRGSLLLCQLLHQAGNAWAAALLPVPDVSALSIYWVLESLVAIGLIVVYGPTRLSRQPVQQVAKSPTAA
jgi:membrane protease YdiL (CAAX protease family)